MEKAAVFLDRDGTIIEDRGHLRSHSEVVFYPETIRSLKRLQQHFRLFVVTNQPGVSLRIVSAEDVQRVNDYVVSELRRHGVTISKVYCCPHKRDDRCACIKPNTFFLEKARDEYGLDLSRSFVIGDHPSDVALAASAGAHGIYVLTGHGAEHRNELPPETVCMPGIREAADWILSYWHWHHLEDDHPGIVHSAAHVLRNGGIVAFPTETVYGLGAAVFNQKAVARVFEVKARPRFDPLIVHVDRVEQLSLVAEEIPPAGMDLIRYFWPGPLTLVLRKTPKVPELVTAGLPTVAVRMPRHPLALALIKLTGMPIAAPSANPFGSLSPTTAEHVVRHLGSRVDMVLDGGPCPVGVESTVVSLVGPRPILLRAGGIAPEEIEHVLGQRLDCCLSPSSPSAPGQTRSHYAPRTPLVFNSAACGIPPGSKVGLLAFCPHLAINGFAAVEVLSRDGDLREAATNLFAALHRLDAMDLDLIVADPIPETGLGLAIMDRLKRASRKTSEEFQVGEFESDKERRDANGE